MSNEKQIREDLISKNFDKNYFVEAGAGAGKTHMITERIVNQIKAGTPAEKIVVITFTNKAANEIRDRIIKRIIEVESDEKDEKIKAHLKAANENIGKMQMSTIHSFCMKILKEQSFKANLRLDVSLLEEKEEINEKRKFFDDWYDANYKDLKEVKDKLKNLGEEYPYNFLFDNFCNMSSNFNDEDFKISEEDLQKYEMVKEKYKLKKDLNENLKQIKKECSNNLRKIKDKQKQVNKLTNQDKRTDLQEEKLKNYPAEIENLEAENEKLLKTLAEKDEFKDLFKDKEVKTIRNVESVIKSLEYIISGYVGTLVVKTLQDTVNDYKNSNRNIYITNNDLILKTRNLLKNNPDVRKYYLDKYDCIYVDEFQDTNQVQIELISELCKNNDGKLNKGHLFVVGDPKQSIYRFQGADLQAYFNFKKQFDEDEIKVLNWNFRSNQRILDFVNENNKKIFDKYDAEVLRNEYKINYKNMEKPEDFPNIEQKLIKDEGSLCGIYQYVSKEYDYKDEYDIVELCNLVKKLVEKFKIVECDDEKYNSRRITYKDILIISPRKKGMKKYINAFNRNNIPTQFTLSMQNNDIKQLYRFVYYYLYVTNLYYDKAKYAYVNTIFYDLKTDIKDEKVNEVLDKMRIETKDMNNYAKANYLIKNYNLVFNKDELSKIEIRNLQVKLQQMLETVISKYDEFDLIDGFYEYIDTEIERDITLKENDNVVRFMNIHKVKGLQGNIVICADREVEREFKASTYHEFNDNKVDYYYTAISFSNDPYPSYGMNDKIMEKEEFEEMAEYDRLAYVECTRAKDVLIFMPCFANKENEYFVNYDLDKDEDIKNEKFKIIDKDWLEQNGEEKKESGDQTTPPVASEKDNPNPFLDEYKDWEEEEVYDFNEKLGSDICYTSPSQFEKNKGIVKTDGISEDKNDNEDDDNEESVYGKTYGVIMHRGFELIVNSGFKLSVDKAIDKAIFESNDDLCYMYQDDKELVDKKKKIKDQLKPIYEKFKDSKDIKVLFDDSPVVYTEYHFNVLVEKNKNKELFENIEKYFNDKKTGELSKKYLELVPNDAKKMYITGQADLIIDKGDKLYIVDYKSDNNVGYDKNDFKKGLINAYEGQLELYAQVMKLIFKDKEIIKYLYNNGNLIEVNNGI